MNAFHALRSVARSTPICRAQHSVASASRAAPFSRSPRRLYSTEKAAEEAKSEPASSEGKPEESEEQKLIHAKDAEILDLTVRYTYLLFASKKPPTVLHFL